MYFYMGFAITLDLFSTLSLLFIFSASVMLFIYLNLDLGVHYQFKQTKAWVVCDAGPNSII